MNLNDAIALLRPALSPLQTRAFWADFGAGAGLFTRALATLLGPAATVLAIDQDDHALATLRKKAPAAAQAATIQTRVADIQDWTLLDALAEKPFDGVLFANSLHFIEAQASLLENVSRRLHPAGCILLIEYDRHTSSKWVPYPISKKRLAVLSEELPLATPRFVSTIPSAFGGEMYCAVLDKQPVP